LPSVPELIKIDRSPPGQCASYMITKTHGIVQLLSRFPDVLLGCVFVLATLTVGTVIALVAGTARERIANSPGRLAAATGAGGALMILLVAMLVVGWAPRRPM
jgi:hypothetical protein